MTLSLAQRYAVARQVPWVRHHDMPAPCSAITSRTPLKALWSMHGSPPVGLDKYRCKNPAHWRFRALKRSFARDGDYCWMHLLLKGFFMDPTEADRFDRWYKRNYPEV